eukprot:TRINITY_DN5850_c0_g1_i5.p1 TRINITY_DN5850_c0_g1~~TRINITY_DN5850_c0_g1_i5.p1  ORF type:complete len:502 (-),score=73.21 TRINITY_DN5850_c0_g1_i5:151-1656(-)
MNGLIRICEAMGPEEILLKCIKEFCHEKPQLVSYRSEAIEEPTLVSQPPLGARHSWGSLLRYMPRRLQKEMEEDYRDPHWIKQRSMSKSRQSYSNRDREYEELENNLIFKYCLTVPQSLTSIAVRLLSIMMNRSIDHVRKIWTNLKSKAMDDSTPPQSDASELSKKFEQIRASMPTIVQAKIPDFSTLQQMTTPERAQSLQTICNTIITNFLQPMRSEEEIQRKAFEIVGLGPGKRFYHGPLERGRVYPLTRNGNVSIVNEYGTDGFPDYFEYISDWDLDSVRHLPFFKDGDWLNFKADCECKGDCKDGKCSHVDFRGCPYDSNGRLQLEKVHRNLLSECNSRCSCGLDCGNRVVQRGSMVKMQIFKTEKKGWGVRTMEFISKGTFVGEYLGEIIPTATADARKHSEYLFDIDAARPRHNYSVDAERKGNVARFFNHSCDPNMQIFNVLTETLNHELHRLAIFAVRDIAPFEELTFDYKYETKRKECRCHCGAPNCRTYFK